MACNRKNPCSGVYGKCLDVKITNRCNGNCAFCIERGGHQPKPAPVRKLIEATNKLSEYTKVLILGGEPFLYPHLVEYVAGISGNGRKIYITTNGSVLTLNTLGSMKQHLTAINISIHHFRQQRNAAIVGTNVDFLNLRKCINYLKGHNVSVRINANLVKGGLDNRDDINDMIVFAHSVGADEIRFAELQGCPELFVDSREAFSPELPRNPFADGCEQDMGIIHDVKVKVRMTCGLVNPEHRYRPVYLTGRNPTTKVMYPDASVYNGWRITPETPKPNDQHDTCHGPRIGCHVSNYSPSYHYGGCH